MYAHGWCGMTKCANKSRGFKVGSRNDASDRNFSPRSPAVNAGHSERKGSSAGAFGIGLHKDPGQKRGKGCVVYRSCVPASRVNMLRGKRGAVWSLSLGRL